MRKGRNIRMALALAIYVACLAAAVYVGGWIMIIKPVRMTWMSLVMGTLTLRQLLVAAAKCCCSLTVSGLIWCIGYIASNHVYDSRDE